MSGAMPRLRVAVVGASSLIGEAVIAELRARKFPLAELHALEDQRNVGRLVSDEDGPDDTELKTSDVAAFDFSRADLAFFCGRAALSERYAEAAAAHAWVIDNSPAFRLRAGRALGRGRRERRAAAPGGSARAHFPARQRERRACHGARPARGDCGARAGGGGDLPGGLRQRPTRRWTSLPARRWPCSAAKRARGRAFGRQIAFNVIPQVDVIEDDGTSREERRLWEETRSLLGLPSLAVNATAVRVPVFFGHSLAVHAAFDRPVGPIQALEVLRRGSGIEVIEGTSTAQFPTPGTLATAPNKVYVGRLRADPTRDRALNFWVVADNVRKCAAHNAVSVAQILVNSAR